MACDDLIYGESVDEVRALLGSPGGEYDRGRTWGYDVGVPEGLLSDYPDLAITFGPRHEVDRVEIPGYVRR